MLDGFERLDDLLIRSIDKVWKKNRGCFWMTLDRVWPLRWRSDHFYQSARGSFFRLLLTSENNTEGLFCWSGKHRMTILLIKLIISSLILETFVRSPENLAIVNIIVTSEFCSYILDFDQNVITILSTNAFPRYLKAIRPRSTWNPPRSSQATASPS